MDSLEFTQAQGLGYTRGMYRVPLSIPTYDSVKSTWHGFSLAHPQATFLLPHGLGVYMIQQHVHCISCIGVLCV